MLNPVTPQVIIGDEISGLGSDDLRTTFRKYNQHAHLTFSAANFLSYNIKLGDPVYVYDYAEQSLFSVVAAPVIDYLSSNQLRINATANIDLTNVVVYVGAPKETPQAAVIINGVDLHEGSNLIEFNPDFERAGFISPQQYDALASYSVNYTLQLTAADVDLVATTLLNINVPAWLLNAAFKITNGSVTFDIKVANDVTANNYTVRQGVVVDTEGGVNLQEFVVNEVAPGAVAYEGMLVAPLEKYSNVELELTDVVIPEGETAVLSCSFNLTKVF